jgi:hypothetical protein
VVGDFNGDGILDLAGAGLVSYLPARSAGGSASIIYGNGDGTFQQHVDYGTSLRFVSLTAADLQGTGAIDLVGAAVLEDGVTGEVAVLRNTPQIALRPSQFKFYQQAIGDISISKTFLMSSAGVAPLKLTSIAAVGDFTQTNSCPSLLNIGANCTLTGNFRPTVAGLRTGGVLVHDNTSAGLAGLFFSGLGYAIKISPARSNFGNVLIGQSVTLAVTISNRGGNDVAITGIAILGPNRSDFTQSNTCGGTVPNHGTCILSVTFRPTKPGTKQAAVVISDSDALNPRSVPLSGIARMR